MLLEGRVMNYAWGQRGPEAFIPRWLGRPAGEDPWAELWFGDHALAPAFIGALGKDLRQGVDGAPASFLGPRAGEFGHRLPFLLKILACDKPLSIQVHPGAEEARIGFAEEEALGIALDDPRRIYKDPFPKPEILLAQTDFHVLAGFRPFPDLKREVERVPELAAFLSGRPFSSVRDVLRCFLTDPEAVSVLDGLTRRLAMEDIQRPFGPDRWEAWFLKAALCFPADRGLSAFFLLNLVHLKPGEAVFLAPGRPHSYLEGAGIEVMAPSDNVLRGGLTPKPLQLDAFLSLLSKVEDPTPVLHPDGEGKFVVPAPFTIESIALESDGSRRVSVSGPEMWIVLEGKGSLSDGAGSVPLSFGKVAFVPGAAGPLVASAGQGPMRVLRVTVGEIV
jgi:mannose-6-phosphate isomerase